jgi:transcription antitermination factor NusG
MGDCWRRGVQSYLPLAVMWRKSHSGPRKMSNPLFRRYVFVHCYLEMYAHLELISIPRLMKILEDPQGRLRVVPEDEVRLLRRLCDMDVSLERKRNQAQGELLEVVKGQPRGISGVIREEAKTTLLVPIHTLQTSVAVEINRGQLMPYADDGEES